MTSNKHPTDPRSNVAKVASYDENLYALTKVPPTAITNEDVIPLNPPKLTQVSVGKYLRPLTKELDEVPPCPTFAELPDAVKERMVIKDIAFWVDKPGENAYTLHEAARTYKLNTEKVFPPHQDVFPRSYLYDIDCVKYRRLHACDGLHQSKSEPDKKPIGSHCKDCTEWQEPRPTSFQLAWTDDPCAVRWKFYPDVQAPIPHDELKIRMKEVGRPFRSEACNWYNKNYPSAPSQMLMRKFSK